MSIKSVTANDSCLHRGASSLLGRTCSEPLVVREDRIICAKGHQYSVKNCIVDYANPLDLEQIPEMRIRYRQAGGYLEHKKFPTQLARFDSFLNSISRPSAELTAVDPGCGPGPYTKRLIDFGYRVLAVDFSKSSLIYNAKTIDTTAPVCFVNADLNDFFSPLRNVIS